MFRRNPSGADLRHGGPRDEHRPAAQQVPLAQQYRGHPAAACLDDEPEHVPDVAVCRVHVITAEHLVLAGQLVRDGVDGHGPRDRPWDAWRARRSRQHAARGSVIGPRDRRFPAVAGSPRSPHRRGSTSPRRDPAARTRPWCSAAGPRPRAVPAPPVSTRPSGTILPSASRCAGSTTRWVTASSPRLMTRVLSLPQSPSAQRTSASSLNNCACGMLSSRVVIASLSVVERRSGRQPRTARGPPRVLRR